MRRIHAHGKAILFGEHAVVYGHPALALGIEDAVVARAVRPTAGRLGISVPGWGLDADQDSPGTVGEALRRLAALLPGDAGCEVEAEASIPMGAGLGSSAALAVLMVRAVAEARGAALDDDRVRAAANELEKVFHGNPSGLDGTVATFGGLCLFRKAPWDGDAPSGVPLRLLAPNVLRVAWPAPPLVIGHSGVRRSTASMVARVGRLREADPTRVDGLFATMGTCLWKGLDALGRGDHAGLGKAMNACQEALAALSLSCPEIDRMMDLALAAGALGAKLTGGGGGGCVLALAPGREQDVLEAFRRGGFDAFLVGVHGPTVEGKG